MFNKFGCILLVMVCLAFGDGTPVSAQAGGVLAYVVADTDTAITSLVRHDLATGVRETLLTHRSANGTQPVPIAVSADGRLAYPALSSESEVSYNLFVWDQGLLTDLGEGFNPAWSADGRLAFSSDRGLYVWDGEMLTNITADASIMPPIYPYQSMWHTDGRLAFQSYNNDGKRDVHVWDGQTLTTVAEGYLMRGIAWRADGCLTFGYRGSAVQLSKLYLWCDGVLTVTELPDIGRLHGDMAWSNDGRLALKITRTNSGDYDPAVYLWDGQTFTFVAETAYAYPMVWSVDGALAFHTQENGLQMHVWQDGVQTDLGSGHAPAWNTDGRLVFDCGFWQICVWDGQTTVQVAAGTNPQWVP
jgi:hypothetical protein